MSYLVCSWLAAGGGTLLFLLCEVMKCLTLSVAVLYFMYWILPTNIMIPMVSNTAIIIKNQFGILNGYVSST